MIALIYSESIVSKTTDFTLPKKLQKDLVVFCSHCSSIEMLMQCKEKHNKIISFKLHSGDLATTYDFRLESESDTRYQRFIKVYQSYQQ